MKKLFVLLLLAALLLASCAVAEDDLYVAPIEGLSEDFIMGMDVSSVLSLENSGVKYYNVNGQEEDLFKILADSGINYIRVRVWNDPFDENGNGYGGGNNDIEAAIIIGQRAAKYGMKLLVDFHYSDFWADPAKQQAPKAWQGMNIDEKREAVYQFTFDCLTRLKEAGADVGMVQLGNETNGKLCGEKIWMNIYYIMDAGSRAARAVDKDILLAVHFANPESSENYLSWASKLNYYNLDYDVFATSYYPYWHGTLDNLKTILSTISQKYDKKVMVVETSYAYTAEDTDFSANTIGEGGAYEKPYPFTVQGQANEVRDVMNAINSIGGIGIFYWEGAWISVGTTSWEENAALWEQYGSGWAASFAGSYDPKDAGVYYGGSACDNQALFNAEGRPLPSLQVFRLVRNGNLVPVVPDAIDDTVLMIDLNGKIVLPETVNAVMNDNSRQAMPVQWDSYDEAAMKNGGVANYTILGKAGDMQAVCTVNMVDYNYIRNFSFEESDTSMWTATDLGKTEQLFVEEKKADSMTGNKHYHFFSTAANSVSFTLEQTLESLPAGTYRYEISIQGGDGGKTDIYSYVKINGEVTATCPAVITSYNNWDTPVIDGIVVNNGDTVTVGISVTCAGAGAWGKIDDAKFNSIK